MFRDGGRLMADWTNKITGHAEVDPTGLLANPANWREHPRAQREALEGVLAQVGWVQDIIVNTNTGHIVDGHLRVELAVERGEAMVPVVYVDLTEDEERLMLATLDPLAGMALADDTALKSLLFAVSADDSAVAALLDSLRLEDDLDVASLVDEDIPRAEPEPPDAEERQLVVTVTAEQRVQILAAIDAVRGGDYSVSAGDALATVCTYYIALRDGSDA